MRQGSSTLIESVSNLGVNIAAFGRCLRAEYLSYRTQETYAGAVRRFLDKK